MAKNRRVVITRPAHQSAQWAARLLAQGFDTISVPLLGIEVVHDAQLQQKIKNCVLQLDQYSALIFVSQNAVKHAFEWIEQYWPQFPVDLALLSVGNKTEKLLKQTFADIYAYEAVTNCVPDVSEMTSEALLACEELNDVEGKKILIFRGVGGRPTLKTLLENKKAIVDLCELYSRTLPSSAAKDVANCGLNPQTDVVTIFSGETLQNFHRIVHQLDIMQWQQVPVLVPSHRVAMMARELGFARVHNALNASEEQMLQGLTGLLSQLS